VLNEVEHAILVAVDRASGGSSQPVDGADVLRQFRSLGVSAEDGEINSAARTLLAEGLLNGHQAFGTLSGIFWLSLSGREVAREADPMQRTYDRARLVLISDAFREAYPRAYERWAAAEALLNGGDAESHLTDVGHRVREAMQEFATAMIAEHNPPDPDPHVPNVERRLGAVIALYRPQLGDARRVMLEQLGGLWESCNTLVQRQEHGSYKEREPLTFVDAHRLVWLTMFLMVEFVMTFEDAQPDPPPAAFVESGR